MMLKLIRYLHLHLLSHFCHGTLCFLHKEKHLKNALIRMKHLIFLFVCWISETVSSCCLEQTFGFSGFFDASLVVESVNSTLFVLNLGTLVLISTLHPSTLWREVRIGSKNASDFESFDLHNSISAIAWPALKYLDILLIASYFHF